MVKWVHGLLAVSMMAGLGAPALAADKAGGVHVAQKTDAIDYSLDIPESLSSVAQLRAWMVRDAETRRDQAIADYREWAAGFDGKKPPASYSLNIKWDLLAETRQLMTLSKGTYTYTGGAHGYGGTEILYWDRVGRRRMNFADLFTNEARALATVRGAFCKKLVAARRERLKGYDDPSVSNCAKFSKEMGFAFTKIVGGKFGRLTVFLPPYVAGSYAEGGYEVELYIPKEMIPFIKPQWKPSFPG